MRVLPDVKRNLSWASDLAHPLPLTFVGILALNDHVLKQSGLIPASITGKLSDFAGLFFFPLLLVSLARGASSLFFKRDIEERRALATGAAIVTAVGFSAVKLWPAANALAAATWGVMVMDPTDLIALPMSFFAAAWMLRKANTKEYTSDFRRAFHFAAVTAAAMASIATSRSQPPQPPPPPPPPSQQAVAVAADASCGELTIDTCERTASQTLVVIRVSGRTGNECAVDVLRAEESSSSGHTGADVLPKNVRVTGAVARTFALTFLRSVPAGERSASLLARAQVQWTDANGTQQVDEVELSGACIGH
ncbi:MAG: hypothetical protein IPK82_01195 [Polyangiaceae bacterium]|nr:hypothetical protein [Polyangiaceae bacterium]